MSAAKYVVGGVASLLITLAGYGWVDYVVRSRRWKRAAR